MHKTIHTRYVIEYGHVYLKNLVEGEYEEDVRPDSLHSANLNHVERLTNLLEDRNVGYDMVVTIDDTSMAFKGDFGSPAFVAARNDYAQEYVDRLPVTPDGYYFESGFGSLLWKLFEMLPEIETDGELGQPDAWGLFHNPSKNATYLYGEHERGESKPDLKIVDNADDASKVTPYTCAAYDTAMSLSKFGLIGGPAEFKPYPHAISLHDASFYRSRPFRDSQLFQQILVDHDIVPIDTANPPRHLEVGPQDPFARIRSFVEDTVSADFGLPDHRRPEPWW